MIYHSNQHGIGFFPVVEKVFSFVDLTPISEFPYNTRCYKRGSLASHLDWGQLLCALRSNSTSQGLLYWKNIYRQNAPHSKPNSKSQCCDPKKKLHSHMISTEGHRSERERREKGQWKRELKKEEEGVENGTRRNRGREREPRMEGHS